MVMGIDQGCAGAGRGVGRGLFVVFEGGDGAGKSTQVARLVEALSSRGECVVATREPGGTAVGAQIRQVLLHGQQVAPAAEALLFAADRAQHVQTVIRPALAAGAVVVCDRYVDSTFAYQGARDDLDMEGLRGLVAYATGGLVPDVTVLLDVSAQVGAARRGGDRDRIEAEPDSFHQAVRDGFLERARCAPQRYLVLDAAAPVEEIAAAVLGRVESLLGERRGERG
ncbi:dTMP kinase [Dermatophilus congolensis]|uniref:dTMP kinase n=1 Tax=Dermatophilus congolensis TaxID=1863 RepID=UPI001FBBB284|nr:dTMP kinase [Dermatophilus congolensis]